MSNNLIKKLSIALSTALILAGPITCYSMSQNLNRQLPLITEIDSKFHIALTENGVGINRKENINGTTWEDRTAKANKLGAINPHVIVLHSATPTLDAFENMYKSDNNKKADNDKKGVYPHFAIDQDGKIYTYTSIEYKANCIATSWVKYTDNAVVNGNRHTVIYLISPGFSMINNNAQNNAQTKTVGATTYYLPSQAQLQTLNAFALAWKDVVIDDYLKYKSPKQDDLFISRNRIHPSMHFAVIPFAKLNNINEMLYDRANLINHVSMICPTNEQPNFDKFAKQYREFGMIPMIKDNDTYTETNMLRDDMTKINFIRSIIWQYYDIKDVQDLFMMRKYESDQVAEAWELAYNLIYDINGYATHIDSWKKNKNKNYVTNILLTLVDIAYNQVVKNNVVANKQEIQQANKQEIQQANKQESQQIQPKQQNQDEANKLQYIIQEGIYELNSLFQSGQYNTEEGLSLQKRLDDITKQAQKSTTNIEILLNTQKELESLLDAALIYQVNQSSK